MCSVGTRQQALRESLDRLRPNTWLDQYLPTCDDAIAALLAELSTGVPAQTALPVGEVGEVLATLWGQELQGKPEIVESDRSSQLVAGIYRELDQAEGDGVDEGWRRRAIFALAYARSLDLNVPPLSVAQETVWPSGVSARDRALALQCCTLDAMRGLGEPGGMDAIFGQSVGRVRVRAAAFYFVDAHQAHSAELMGAAAQAGGEALLAEVCLVVAMRHSRSFMDPAEIWSYLRAEDMHLLGQAARVVAAYTGASHIGPVLDPSGKADVWMAAADALPDNNQRVRRILKTTLASRSAARGDFVAAHKFAVEAAALVRAAGYPVPPDLARWEASPESPLLSGVGLPADLFLHSPGRARRIVSERIACLAESRSLDELATQLASMRVVCAQSPACGALIDEAAAELAGMGGDHDAWCRHTASRLEAEDQAGVRVPREPADPQNTRIRTARYFNEDDAETESFDFDPKDRARQCRDESRDALAAGHADKAVFWSERARVYDAV